MERKIIDISHHNGKIDFSKVKKEVDGVIIRCGYGKNIASQDDKKFTYNVEECIKHNIPFGVYLYSYAKDMDSVYSEADHVKRLLKPYKGKLSYPVYLDLEEAGSEKGCVERAKLFAKIIEEAGYTFGVYANQYWFNNYIKDGLDRYTKWVARYSKNSPTGFCIPYDMWQYSSEGSVYGISGNVDMNICYKDFPSIIKPEKEKAPTFKIPSLKGYKGFSIVDGLKQFGYESSFAYRGEIWKALGHNDKYKGTSAQNIKLLNYLKTH